MNIRLIGLVVVSYLACGILTPDPAHSAASAGDSSADTMSAGAQLEEIVVTARRREESLQDVPDSVTAFTAATIEAAGITQVADFAALTPNLNFLDGRAYRSGFMNLTMRGIGNGQEGFPSVAYVVDGVPAESTDALNSGTLVDIERIEVLRGPQSALYGFNAIAGAINVITRRPVNDWSYKARLSYGNGDDRRVEGIASGALIPDRALASISVSYKNDAGRIASRSNGIGLDFTRQTQVKPRLLLTPLKGLEIDFAGSVLRETNGSTYQTKVPDESYLDDFSSTFGPRRGFPGVDHRRLDRASVRIQYDAGAFVITSVTSYSDVRQNIAASVCYDDPSDPAFPAPGGGAMCLFGPAYGSAAASGQVVDDYFDSRDNSRTFVQDLRLESGKASAFEWMLGASLLNRKALVGFDMGLLVAPGNDKVLVFPTWNRKKDDWVGAYGQATWKATDRIEFTVAARLDDQRYRNTSYTDHTLTTIIQVPSKEGVPVDTQKESKTAFQPKGQLSYHFSSDVMAYATVSRGFRSGYFLSGSFTLPESTTNYEVGLKVMGWNQRLMTNIAAFHIDYSDQQFSTAISQPPYRVAVIIPKTKIDGIEVETSALPSEYLRIGAGLGYLNAKVDDGTRAPATPRFTANASADLSIPIAGGWGGRIHVDGRYNSSQYLYTQNTQEIGAKTYLNLRAGVHKDRIDVGAYARNLTNERQSAMQGYSAAGGFMRYDNEPRTYGAEITVSF